MASAIVCLIVADAFALKGQEVVGDEAKTTRVLVYLFSELSEICTSATSPLPGSAVAAPEAGTPPVEPLALTV